MGNASKIALKDTWNAGGGAFAGITRHMNAIGRMLRRVSITGGSGYWDADGLHLTIFSPDGAVESFTPSLEYDGTTYTVKLTAGKRSTDRTDWEDVAEFTATYTAPGVLYMTYTYTTLDDAGEVNVAGAWTGPLYGEPPEQDETIRVIRFARVEKVEEVPTLTIEQTGNVFVIDLVQC
jgi:hypothetical protein